MNQDDNLSFVVPDLIVPERDGGYSKGHETREMILRAALSILIDEGYRAMSMRRVAAACGMKFGNLTYHYRTREDLVRELLDGMISSYEVEFEAIVHQPDLTPDERLERYCRLVLDDITTKKTTRLFPELWALSNHDPFVYERMHELYTRARRPLFEVVAEIRPDLSTEDQETLTLFISYSMEGSTIFAGYEKPFRSQMNRIKHVSIEAFRELVHNFKRS
ncbi:TetR/AcrR family transcriptional regulator [Sphingomonas lycopersici]|uniref:TetR/AcrR family transcriptional regulator n=1 Tax=Sphingomonas lycopersici TaxID=2951807 RepID=UPI0022385D09|nr:TetR/AcrR family transcriptional regulator [Sphingomonas lycopersici]